MSHWSRNPLTLFSLALLPAAISVGYQIYQTVENRQIEVELAKQNIALLAEQKTKPVKPDVVMLEYPKLEQGKPLALLRAKLIRQNAEQPLESGSANVNSDSSTKQVAEKSNDVPRNVEKKSKELTLDELDLSELSPELAKLVQGALDESDSTATEAGTKSEPIAVTTQPDKLAESRGKYEGRLPPLDLQTHMYATDSKRRWVKINGRELNEGDWLDNDIQLISITPRIIVIEFAGQPIEIPALFEWKG
ncbi:general secretion pathway protein GspB [Vibrio sp. HN007]|uniref:general secretion pathway protein GspB n=1 Tax=Vibrio iocasae TaxID=3098914 RepID=UPI0035D3F2CD